MENKFQSHRETIEVDGKDMVWMWQPRPTVAFIPAKPLSFYRNFIDILLSGLETPVCRTLRLKQRWPPRRSPRARILLQNVRLVVIDIAWWRETDGLLDSNEVSG
jgi:hypothetical protein